MLPETLETILLGNPTTKADLTTVVSYSEAKATGGKSWVTFFVEMDTFVGTPGDKVKGLVEWSMDGNRWFAQPEETRDSGEYPQTPYTPTFALVAGSMYMMLTLPVQANQVRLGLYTSAGTVKAYVTAVCR